jgi:hypothetical protein
VPNRASDVCKCEHTVKRFIDDGRDRVGACSGVASADRGHGCQIAPGRFGRALSLSDPRVYLCTGYMCPMGHPQVSTSSQHARPTFAVRECVYARLNGAQTSMRYGGPIVLHAHTYIPSYTRSYKLKEGLVERCA